MELINGVYIIGLDHGYGNMKTANYCFPTGLATFDYPPMLSRDLLEYDGKYYQIGLGHKHYAPSKVDDEEYYILTLAGIAKELSRNRVTEATVHIAAGLPLTWLASQMEAFRAYLLRNKEVTFRFRNVDYRIIIHGVDIYPQGYAAIAVQDPELFKQTLLCDIGNGTMNLLHLKNGIPDPRRMRTEKMGTQQCVQAIQDAIMNRYQVPMDEEIITEFLTTGNAALPKDYLKIMRQAAEEYVKTIFLHLNDYDYTPETMQLYVVGGGGCLIQNFRKTNPKQVIINPDICATAKGYEYLAASFFAAKEG